MYIDVLKPFFLDKKAFVFPELQKNYKFHSRRIIRAGEPQGTSLRPLRPPYSTESVPVSQLQQKIRPTRLFFEFTIEQEKKTKYMNKYRYQCFHTNIID